MTQRNLAASVRKYLPFIKFSLVGVLNTAIDFLLFTLLDYLGVFALIAHTCSYTAGLINSYFWNKFWTFRQPRRYSVEEAVRFILVNLVALGIAGGIILVCIQVFAFSDVIAKAISIPFSFAINFVGSKYLVFRGQPKPPPPVG
ncbi:MAG TPA: GtrA family protein [Spirochaetia bacterium]|nr:GtrA family protein [Spirochaetia bacterium]